MLLSRVAWRKIIFWLILAIGIILRLYKWNSYSFWFDEVIWLDTRQCSLVTLLKNSIFIYKPPLFRFLLYFLWVYVGQGEFTLRLLPFIFGVLSIPLIYKVGVVLFNEEVGLAASFLLSISPLHIYYSQELTHYTLTVFLSLFSIYYLILTLRDNKINLWIKFTLLTVFSLYSQFLILFLLIAENIFFFFSFAKYKNLAKKWLLSQLIILLLYLPLAIMTLRVLHFSASLPQVDWYPKGSLAHIFQLLRIFNAGYNADFIVQLFASLLVFPLFLSGLYYCIKNNIQIAKFLALWIFSPVILAILFSKIQPVFTYRNFIFILPAYYIFVALGITKFKRFIRLSIFSFIILSSLALFNYYRNVFPYTENFYRPGVHPKKDNRGASEYVINNLKKGDVVFHTSHSTDVPYIYYLSVFIHKKINNPTDFFLYYPSFFNNKDVRNYYYGLDGSSVRKDSLSFQLYPSFLINNENEIINIAKGYNRIWLLFSDWEPQLLAQDPDRDQNKIKRWLDGNFNMISHKHFSGVEVYSYQIPNT